MARTADDISRWIPVLARMGDDGRHSKRYSLDRVHRRVFRMTPYMRALKIVRCLGAGPVVPGELPLWLQNEVVRHTNMPWWNGKAYDDFRGLSASIRIKDRGIGDAIDDLSDVIEWLRDEKQFDKADRLRTIAGRLARLRKPQGDKQSNLIRDIARGWK